MMGPLTFLCSTWKADSIAKEMLNCDWGAGGYRNRERNFCDPYLGGGEREGNALFAGLAAGA